MTEFIRTEKKNGKRFYRAIAVALVCALLVTALMTFAACGSKTLYTYEQVMSGTYVLTETDDETVGKTLKEIEAELENEFDCDFKKMTDEDGIIYLIRDSGIAQTEEDPQTNLSDDFLANTIFKRNDGENLMDYLSRCVELAVNTYFENNNMENDYEYCNISESKLTQPIYTDGTIRLFYDALNKNTGKIVLGYIEINVSEKNREFLAPFFTRGLDGDLKDYSKAVEGILVLISESNEVNMTEDIGENTLREVNYMFDWYSKKYGFNENEIRFSMLPGKVVMYEDQLYFLRSAWKNEDLYITLTPVTCNIETYDKDSFPFIFRDANTDEILWIELINNPMSPAVLYQDDLNKAAEAELNND